MRKAIIENGIVINIIETGSNGINGIQLPLNQILWDCTQYAVGIGDKFVDGTFYRENEPVKYIPSTEEKVAQLEYEKEQLKKELETTKAIANDLLLQDLKNKELII